MLTLLRLMRPMAALVVVLLLANGMMPLVQHACAMTKEAPHHAHHPCADDAQDGMHEGMHGHEARPSGHPCDHDASLPATPMPMTCCLVQAAPGVMTTAVQAEVRLPAFDLLTGAAVSVETLPIHDNRFSHHLFFDVGPPPATAVSLHLLHATLLN